MPQGAPASHPAGRPEPVPAGLGGQIPGSVEVTRVPLESGLTPTDVLRLTGGDPWPFALSGRWAGGGALIGSDPLVALEGSVEPFGALDHQPEVTRSAEGAVGGGWVGYLGYGLGALIEPVVRTPLCSESPPSSMLGFYDHLVRYETSTGQWFFEALWSKEQARRLEDRMRGWQRRLAEPPPGRAGYHCGSFASRPRAQAHRLAVARAIEHIRSGDVYQVNVCLGLRADFTGEPVEAWCTGVERLGPAYGAYLGYPGFAVASFSPELFLRRQGSHVLTSPIKGTAAAGPERALQGLALSAKDRAENVMIVDLMRNDLGRVCRFGTVEAPELCRPESHPGVWHLVSDVVGELAPGVSDGRLLRATFPPGSVTGAPKVKAMELIAALESERREVYTGCIGIASPVSGLELNVAIRTFEVCEGAAWLGIGSGVVADSDPSKELAECIAKAAPLVAGIGGKLDPTLLGERSGRSAPGLGAPTGPVPGAQPRPGRTPDPALGVFETVLVLGGRPVALEAHLARMATSVAALYRARLSPSLGAEVLDLASGLEGPHRLRVVATPGHSRHVELELAFEPAHHVLGRRPGQPVGLVAVELPGGLGEHKWRDRRLLAEFRPRSGSSDARAGQLLLVEPDGTALEAERANVFAVQGNVLRTPPADGRILPGTTRDAIIHVAGRAGMAVSHGPLDLQAMARASEVFLTSSVSGVLPVGSLGRLTWPAPGPRTTRLCAGLWAYLVAQASVSAPVLSS